MDDLSAKHERVKSALEWGQATIEALVAFLQERVSIETTYSKSLLKLSKHSLAIDEKITEPVVFEALASMRGDIANESVQHSELATSINRDVLEPLIRQRDSSEAINKISAETKRVTKDMKLAYERCRKSYAKYIALHKKAVDACTSAGLPAPPLWVPPTDSPTVRGSGTPSLAGGSSSTHVPHLSLSAASSQQNSPHRVAPSRTQSLTSDMLRAAATAAAADGSMPRAAASGIAASGIRRRVSVGPAALDSIIERTTSGTHGGHGVSMSAPATPLQAVADTVGEEDAEGDSSARGGEQDATTPRQSRKVGSASSSTDGAEDVGDVASVHSSGSIALQHTTPTVEGSSQAKQPSSQFEGKVWRAEIGSFVPANSVQADRTLDDQEAASVGDSLGEQSSSILGGALSSSFGQRRRSVDEGSDASYTSFDNVSSGLSGRIKAMTSSVFSLTGMSSTSGALAVPAATDVANLSTAERIESMRVGASTAVQASDDACTECQEAWAAHARARDKFYSQFTAATVLFQEIEKRRVAEVSDSLRKYTVFLSSLHANLQYDTQMLSGKVEAVAHAQATTQHAITAFAAAAAAPATVAAASAASVLDRPVLESLENGGSSSAALAENGVQSPGLDSISSQMSISRLGSRVFSALPSMSALSNLSGASKSEEHDSGSTPVHSRAADFPMASPKPPLPHHSGAAAELVSPVPSSSGGYLAQLGAMTGISSPAQAQHTSATSPAPSAAIPPHHGIASNGSGGMGRFFGIRTGSRPATSSPLAPRVGHGDGAGTAAATAATPAVATSAAAPKITPDKPRTNAPSPTTNGATPSSASSSASSSSGLRNMLGTIGLGRLAGSSPAASNTVTTKPSPKQAGVSVSVSVLGSVRNQGAVGVGVLGVKETAAMLHQLHIEPGPTEYLVEALFDPLQQHIELREDGSIQLLLDAAGEHADVTESHEDAIPSLSLADFASGKSPVSTPVTGRSRGGTAASKDSATLLAEKPDGQHSPGDGAAASASAAHIAASLAALGDSVEGEHDAGLQDGGHSRRSSTGALPSDLLNPVVPRLLGKVQQLMRESPDGLARLVMLLDARRAENSQLSRPAADSLILVLGAALDAAAERNDFARGRALMVISQTFYYISVAADSAAAADANGTSTPDKPARASKRVYLQAHLRDHPLWQNMQFWDGAIYESIGAEMGKGTSTGKKEQRERENDVIFGQLGFWAYNMISFSVPEDSVRKILIKYAKFIHLDDNQQAMLMAHVSAFVSENNKSNMDS